MSIQGIKFPQMPPVQKHVPVTNSQEASGGFADKLADYVNQYNVEAKSAVKDAEAVAVGDTSNKSMSETILALQKADLSFQMMLSVRNKLVDAYREVMRMQV